LHYITVFKRSNRVPPRVIACALAFTWLPRVALGFWPGRAWTQAPLGRLLGAFDRWPSVMSFPNKTERYTCQRTRASLAPFISPGPTRGGDCYHPFVWRFRLTPNKKMSSNVTIRNSHFQNVTKNISTLFICDTL
jgi:hypothetical protein